MKRTTNVDVNSKSENTSCDASENENNFSTNNCSKICSVPNGGVRAKVKQHFCNIGSDSLKVNKNGSVQNGAASSSLKYSGLQNGACHATATTSSSISQPCQSTSSAQKSLEKEGNDIDYYIRHNVDSLNAIEKCPSKVGNQSLESNGSNGHVTNKMWNLRDDESSSGNEADEALSDHECCIYTYKGDQFADLPSSFFTLDMIANGSDQVVEAEPPKELPIDENERSQSGSSPEMDFLEMDFDPGPSIEQDSEEDYDCFEGKSKTGGNVSPVPELPNEQVTENDLSGNQVNDTELNIVLEKMENDFGISSNFMNSISSEPQPGPSNAGLTLEFSEKTSTFIKNKSTECNNNNSNSNNRNSSNSNGNSNNGSSSNSNGLSRLCWPPRDSWGHHYTSGDLYSPGDSSESDTVDSVTHCNSGNLKMDSYASQDSMKYNLNSPHCHCIAADRLMNDKRGSADEASACFDSIEGDCPDYKPTVDTTMIWSEKEACSKQVTQISTSACGAAVVINVLIAFNMRFSIEKVKESVGTRLRAESAPIPQYLFSRSMAGVTHIDLIRGIHESSNGALYARFFHMHPEREFSLSKWLSHWMKMGAVPIATLNLQNGISPGNPIPDAWHHQMIFGVSSRGIFLTNPLECVHEEALLSELCSPSILKVKRSDIISKWHPGTDLRPLASHSDKRWREMNVLGQVVNVIRESTNTCVQGRVITQHISIPASYSSGITLVVARDSPGYEELMSVRELPERIFHTD